MARTPLVVKVLTNQVADPVVAGSAEVAYVASDVVDDNSFATIGRELLLAHNDTAGALNLTLTAADDPWGRDKVLTYSVPAGETHVFGPFLTQVWRQTGNVVHVDGAAVGLLLAVVRVP